MCSRVFGETKVWGCPTNGGKSSPGSARIRSDNNNNASSSSSQPKILELENSMHPQFIAFQILLAINCSSYNGLRCNGLNLLEDDNKTKEGENDDRKVPAVEGSSKQYLKHLKALIYSRKWLRMEFVRCPGVESLLLSSSPPVSVPVPVPVLVSSVVDKEQQSENGDGGSKPRASDQSAAAAHPSREVAASNGCTTEVDFLMLTLPRLSRRNPSEKNLGSYDEKRQERFFASLWTRWKVRKLVLSMDFSPEWTKEFCRFRVSELEELELHEDCFFPRRSTQAPTPVRETTSPEEATNGKTGSGPGDDDNTTNDGDGEEDTKDAHEEEKKEDAEDRKPPERIDCWKFFCQNLRINHPNLKSLQVRCKTGDEELAYLIDEAIAPACLPLEELRFGRMCFCGEKSLRALTRAMTARGESALSPPSPAQPLKTATTTTSLRWKTLSMFRERPQTTRGNPDGPPPAPQTGLLEFCRALRHAPSLALLELGCYIIGASELKALLDSLVLASGRIERLSLLFCYVTNPSVYVEVLCGRGPLSTSALVHDRLPELRFFLLPGKAWIALEHVLRVNTAIESISSIGCSKKHEYYLDLNRGGRRMLKTGRNTDCNANNNDEQESNAPASSGVPPSLWPLVLQRASWEKAKETHRYAGGKRRQYDVVYCLLRNRILLES